MKIAPVRVMSGIAVDPVHDRPEHEGEQPGQEEDHDQVAEDRRRSTPTNAEDDEARGRCAPRHEDRVEPAALPRRQLEAHRAAREPSLSAEPIFSRTSAIVVGGHRAEAVGPGGEDLVDHRRASD